MNHTNPIRSIALAHGLRFELVGPVALHYRKFVWRNVRPTPLPSGTMSGTDWKSSWPRIPATTRRSVYDALDALYDDMARLAAEEREAKGYADDYRW